MIRKFLFVFAAIMLSMAMASCSNNIDEPEEGDTTPSDTYIDKNLLGNWRCATDFLIEEGRDYVITVDSIEVVFEENGECYFLWLECVGHRDEDPSYMTRQSEMYRYTVSNSIIRIYNNMGFNSEAGYHIDDDLVTFTPVGDTDIFPSGKEVSATLSKNAFEGLVYQRQSAEPISKKLVGTWKSDSELDAIYEQKYRLWYSDLELVFMENGECYYRWNENSIRWQTWYDENYQERYSEWRNTSPHGSGKYHFTIIDDIIKINNDGGWWRSEMKYTIKDDVLNFYKIDGFATYPDCKLFQNCSEWELSFLSYAKQ